MCGGGSICAVQIQARKLVLHQSIVQIVRLPPSDGKSCKSLQIRDLSVVNDLDRAEGESVCGMIFALESFQRRGLPVRVYTWTRTRRLHLLPVQAQECRMTH